LRILQETAGFEESEDFQIDLPEEETAQTQAETEDIVSFDDEIETDDDIFPSFDDFGDLDEELETTEGSEDEGENLFDSSELPDLDMPGEHKEVNTDEEVRADHSELDEIPSFGLEDLGDASEDQTEGHEEGFMWDESEDDSTAPDTTTEVFGVSDEGTDSFDFESEIGDINTVETGVESSSDEIPSSEDAFEYEQSQHPSAELELEEQSAAPQTSHPPSVAQLSTYLDAHSPPYPRPLSP